MTSKVKLSKSTIINSILSAFLAVVILYIVAPIFHLSGILRYTIMIILCTCTSLIVILKLSWVLSAICLLVMFIGVALVFLAQNKEIIAQISWNPSMLGAGASLIALALAFYMLFIERGQSEEPTQLADGERRISNLKEKPEKGYIWLENIEKYRCDYCLYLGRYHYCKTLGGIKRHIARKH